MKRKWKLILRAFAFVLLCAAALSLVTLALRRKTYSGAWNYMAKAEEFYALDRNSLDYVCLGSSHAYCTVNPLEIYHQTGLTGFVLATQRQPLSVTYYYLKEVLKTQSPKIVLLEGYMGVHEDTPEAEVYYDALDPLRPSFNKLSAIFSTVPSQDRLDFLFEISKYHTRWKEVDPKEATKPFGDDLEDIYCGFVCLAKKDKSEHKTPDYTAVPKTELSVDTVKAFDDILALTRENGAELILLIAPSDTSLGDEIAGFSAELDWAQKNGVRVIDVLSAAKSLGITDGEDYYDPNHLNRFGAKKASEYIAQQLTATEFPRAEYDKTVWDEKYETYLKKNPS